MDYQIENEIKNHFWRGSMKDACNAVEAHLGNIDFDDEDDVEKMIGLAADDGELFIGRALIAARNGKNEFTEMLIEKSADVNAVNNEAHSALYYASEAGFTEIVEQLLMAGAEN